MTLVNVVLTKPLADGSLVPATGVLRFTPTRRRALNGSVVLPVPFVVQLTLGMAEVDLAPNDVNWVWRVDEHVTGTPSRTIYANVPDQVSMSYTDLVAIDPTTLEPEPTGEPAWAPYTVTPDPDNPGFYLIGA
jgi:hypothetical protein